MKKNMKVLLFGLLGLMACQTSGADQAQSVTKNLSDDEVVKIVDTYNSAHSRDVMPTEVLRKKFTADFPKAKDVEWELTGDIYEVDFDISFADYKALYDEKGTLLMYKTDIAESKLPAIVKNAIYAKYPKYKIEDADKIFAGKSVYYEIEAEWGDVDVKALFKDDGTFIKELYD
jgi:hypothetical protein